MRELRVGKYDEGPRERGGRALDASGRAEEGMRSARRPALENLEAPAGVAVCVTVCVTACVTACVTTCVTTCVAAGHGRVCNGVYVPECATVCAMARAAAWGNLERG